MVAKTLQMLVAKLRRPETKRMDQFVPASSDEIAGRAAKNQKRMRFSSIDLVNSS